MEEKEGRAVITAGSLLYNYDRNLILLHEKTDGLSHAESLLQPPAPGNCINWIVGHIAAYRNRILALLGEGPTLGPELAQRYARDSAPVLGDEPGVVPLAELVRALDAAQGRLAIALQGLSPERAAEVVSLGQFTMPTGEWMIFLLRHEGYHTGQLELLHELVVAARSKPR